MIRLKVGFLFLTIDVKPRFVLPPISSQRDVDWSCHTFDPCTFPWDVSKERSVILCFLQFFQIPYYSVEKRLLALRLHLYAELTQWLQSLQRVISN